MDAREKRKLDLQAMLRDAEGRRLLEISYRASQRAMNDSGVISVKPTDVSHETMIERILEAEFPPATTNSH